MQGAVITRLGRLYLRQSWVIAENPWTMTDKTIINRLNNEPWAGGFSRKPDDVVEVTKAILPPIYYATEYCKRWGAIKPFTDMPEDDSRLIHELFSINDNGGYYSTILVNSISNMSRIVSYLTATYAFTTYIAPTVVGMSEVVDNVVVDWGGDRDSPMWKRWFLVITDVFDEFHALNRNGGKFIGFLEHRR